MLQSIFNEFCFLPLFFKPFYVCVKKEIFILWLAILWPAYEWQLLLEMSDILKFEYRAIVKF